MTRWFEDIVIDEVFDLGSHTFTADEIIRFGKLYDPQYFHIDPDLAKHSHFGGLVASGWHTAAVGHRKMVDALDAESERLKRLGQKPGVSGPSPGGSRIEFDNPVRPGDTISYRLSVTAKRQSQSLPGWGILSNRMEATNQHGEQVYLSEFAGFSKLRDYRLPARLKLLLAISKVPGIGGLLKRAS